MVREKERTAELAFSSELPVIRWWGIEILDHSPGSMRMGRAKRGIALLFNHDRNIHLGKLNEIRIDKDRVARGEARFGKGPAAVEKLEDVRDGILTDVSVGYEIHRFEEMDPKEMPSDLVEVAAREKLPVYRITDWEPVEASLVTVAADPTVGVGRTDAERFHNGGVVGSAVLDALATISSGNVSHASSAEYRITTDGLGGENVTWNTTTGSVTISEGVPETEEVAPTKTPEVTVAMEKNERTLEEMEKDLDAQRKKAGDDARDRERARVQGINDIYEKFHNFIPELIRRKAVEEGMALQDFQALALKRLEEPKPVNTPIGELGMSNREISRYSITRAILSQWPGHREKGIDPSFELAMSAEVMKKVDSDSRRGGIFVPYDVLRQFADPRGTGQRDLTIAGGGAAGAYLVGTDHLGSEFIDVLRNTMLLRRLGARVLSGLRGNVNIPRRTAGVTTYWLATEGTGPTEGANTFGQLALTPKHIGARLDYTRNLLLQSNPSIDALVNGDFAVSLALGQDKAGFHGAGSSGEPEGIENCSGIGSVTGTSIAYAGMLDFQSDVAAANALAGNCAYCTTPAVAALLAQRARFSNTDTPLWKGNILEAQDACGFRGYSSNQISAATMFFGDFSQVIIAEWGVLELVVDPYTQSANGIIQVTAFQTMDIGVRIPGAFSMATSIT